VDSIDEIFDEFQAQVIDGYAGPVNGWTTLKEEAKAGVHSLLISKLPEKKNRKPDEEYMYCITCNQNIDSLEADCFCSIHNLAVDDMKAVLDEMFGVGEAKSLKPDKENL
jgi:hypothetical protein